MTPRRASLALLWTLGGCHLVFPHTTGPTPDARVADGIRDRSSDRAQDLAHASEARRDLPAAFDAKADLPATDLPHGDLEPPRDASAPDLPTCGVCDDGNPCTKDLCAGGTCTFTALLDGSTCTSDTDLCTVEHCVSGKCVYKSTVTCAVTMPCVSAACDSVNGCTTTPTDEGHSCMGPGKPGICRSGICCIGCWNGTSCVTVTTQTEKVCGSEGSPCQDCFQKIQSTGASLDCVDVSCVNGGCVGTAANEDALCDGSASKICCKSACKPPPCF